MDFETKFADPFIDAVFSPSNEPDQKKAVPDHSEPQKSKSETSAFRPSASKVEELDEIPAFSEDDIFDHVETAFRGKVGSMSAQKPAEGFRDTPADTPVKELVDPDTIEITAVMYVEILEAVTIILCEWVSGFPNPLAYSFKKSLKERYEKISALLIQAENISITPMHLFLLMTILLVGGSVWRAYSDKKKVAKRKEFAKRSKAYNSEDGPGPDILPDSERTKFEPRVVNGTTYYQWNRLGKYAKKDELEEVPPQLSSFIFDYQKRNGKWPAKKDVDQFLNSK